MSTFFGAALEHIKRTSNLSVERALPGGGLVEQGLLVLDAGAGALELRRLELGERLLRRHQLQLHVLVQRLQLAAADVQLLFL